MLIMLAESRHRRCKLSRHPANAGLINHGQKMAAPAVVASARAFQKTTADAIAQATGQH
jgi:hypothetical protein